jgi:hypothetical protein
VNITRSVVLARVALVMVLLGAAALTLQEYRQQSAAEQRAAAERGEKQRRACALLTRALSVVESRKRYDLSAERMMLYPATDRYMRDARTSLNLTGNCCRPAARI